MINKEKFNRIADKIGNGITIATATLFIIFSISNAIRAFFAGKNAIAVMLLLIFFLSIKLYKVVKKEVKQENKSDKQD